MKSILGLSGPKAQPSRGHIVSVPPWMPTGSELTASSRVHGTAGKPGPRESKSLGQCHTVESWPSEGRNQARWPPVQGLFTALDFPRPYPNPLQQLGPVTSTFSSRGPGLQPCSPVIKTGPRESGNSRGSSSGRHTLGRCGWGEAPQEAPPCPPPHQPPDTLPGPCPLLTHLAGCV